MKKRILSLALACFVTAAALAGCAGSGGAAANAGGGENTGAKTTQSTEKPADPAASGAKKEGDLVLKWAVWDIGMTVYYQPLIDGFEAANPGVKIEMVDLGSSDYQTVLATELTGSGSDFDIVTVKDMPGYTTLVGKGVLEPLDQFAERDNFDLSGYNGMTDQIRVDKTLYELPFRSDFWVLFYNKDVFDKAGVSYPTNDLTFDQYDALARSVTNTTPGQEVYGAHYHTWRSAIQLFGILDGNHTIVDGSYDFLKPYYELILGEQNDGICQDYATLKTSSLHYSGAFAQGNVAMMNMGSWFIPTLIEKIKTGEYTDVTNWGIAKYPHATGVEPGSTIGTITALAIPTSAPNKDRAWDFVSFVCGDKGAEILAKTGTIPALMTDKVVDLISSMDGFPADETSADALYTANTYLEMPLHEKSSEIEVILNEAHDNIMTENVTLDEGIQQMSEQIGALLAK